jgi:hypothetical protein
MHGTSREERNGRDGERERQTQSARQRSGTARTLAARLGPVDGEDEVGVAACRVCPGSASRTQRALDGIEEEQATHPLPSTLSFARAASSRDSNETKA